MDFAAIIGTPSSYTVAVEDTVTVYVRAFHPETGCYAEDIDSVILMVHACPLVSITASDKDMDSANTMSESDPETDYLNKETSRRLHVLLHSLSEPYKEVFTLRIFGELSFTQIGELFGKTDNWARLIFYRAKKQLQEAMK